MYAYERRRPSRHMREAASVDKLVQDIGKAQSALEKAVDAVEAAAASLVVVSNSATEIGGKVKQTVPSQVEATIKKLTDICNQLTDFNQGSSQTSLKNIEDYVLNMPARDLMPRSVEDQVNAISMKPDLSQGPQSSVLQKESYGPMLSMETLHEDLGGDYYEAITEPQDDGLSELTSGLDYDGGMSPIDQSLNQTYEPVNDDYGNDLDLNSSADGALTTDALSAEGEPLTTTSDGLQFDAIAGAVPSDSSGMMSEFESAPIGEELPALE